MPLKRYSRLCTAIEVANRIMEENESSREEVTIDLVILPPDRVDLLTDDEDVSDNISNNEFPSEIAGSIEIAIEGKVVNSRPIQKLIVK